MEARSSGGLLHFGAESPVVERTTENVVYQCERCQSICDSKSKSTTTCNVCQWRILLKVAVQARPAVYSTN